MVVEASGCGSVSVWFDGKMKLNTRKFWRKTCSSLVHPYTATVVIGCFTSTHNSWVKMIQSFWEVPKWLDLARFENYCSEMVQAFTNMHFSASMAANDPFSCYALVLIRPHYPVYTSFVWRSWGTTTYPTAIALSCRANPDYTNNAPCLTAHRR